MFSPAGFEGFFRGISRADSRGTLDEAEMDRLTRGYGAVWVPDNADHARNWGWAARMGDCPGHV